MTSFRAEHQASLPTKSTRTQRVKRAPSRGTTIRVVWHVLIFGIVAVELYPFVWMFLGSFKSQFDFLNSPFWALPSVWRFDNYAQALIGGNLAQDALNSVLATGPSLLLSIVFGVAAAFALQVMVWKGRSVVVIIFLTGIMIPGQMILLPLFTMYYQAGLTSTLWPLIITYTATSLPLTVFFVAVAFRSVPRELFEAAVIDGAGVFRAFWSIGVPLVRNSIVTLSIIEFFGIWNDLLIAITFTNSADLRTLQVGLLSFTDQRGLVNYGPTFAAVCLNVLAMLIVFVLLNKRMMSGLAAGAVKG